MPYLPREVHRPCPSVTHPQDSVLRRRVPRSPLQGLCSVGTVLLTRTLDTVDRSLWSLRFVKRNRAVTPGRNSVFKSVGSPLWVSGVSARGRATEEGVGSWSSGPQPSRSPSTTPERSLPEVSSLHCRQVLGPPPTPLCVSVPVPTRSPNPKLPSTPFSFVFVIKTSRVPCPSVLVGPGRVRSTRLYD